MLTVIKKNSRKENFSIEKIKISIANSANDINFMLNKIDIDMLAEDVEKKIIRLRGIDGETSSYEIRCLTYEALHDLTFNKVANSYYKLC